MTFKRVDQFNTNNPAKLDRELSQLETNISAEFELSARTYAKQAKVDTFTPVTNQPIVALLPGQQLSIDTTAASARAVLPPITPSIYGKPFIIIKRSAANTVVVTCEDPNVTHNGGAFPTLAAVGPKVFYCDSLGYYS